MTHFAVTYRYLPNTDEVRNELRPSHVEFLQGLFDAGTLIVSGPTGDDATPGALLIITADSVEAAHATMQADPFNGAGVLERSVIEWRPYFGKEKVAS